MSTRWLSCSLALALTLLSACGGDEGGAANVEPLPAGSGLYFTDGSSGSDNANFYKLNEASGDTALLPTKGDSSSASAKPCPAIAALDARGDGMVLAVARRTAEIHAADARTTVCSLLAPVPEVMRALAVRSDGRIFTVSVTNKLYQLDAQGRVLAATLLLCPAFAPTCPVGGIDFAPDGTLYAIVEPGLWSRIDTVTAQLTTLKSGVGLSDDFDIDANGKVRGLASQEFRSFDLAGNPSGHAINVFGGTVFATGVVYR